MATIAPQGPFRIEHVPASVMNLEHWAVIDSLGISRGCHGTEKAARAKVAKLNKYQPIYIALIPTDIVER